WPTPPGTCSTPGTWSPAPRPPTSRWCSSTRARGWSSRPAATPRCRPS
ncbi:MAG: Sulfate adenylyltransferase subunit 1, partial [uncultured Nocardioidaceae bacterium]